MRIKLNIEHNMAAQTIEFEKGRKTEKMDSSSLLQCFEASIIFKNNSSGAILLRLEEVALIGFSGQLYDSLNSISFKDEQLDKEVMLNDFYGSFQIIMKSKHGEVEIIEPHKKKQFVVEYNDFKQSILLFLKNVNLFIANTFPELKDNENYIDIQNKFLH